MRRAEIIVGIALIAIFLLLMAIAGGMDKAGAATRGPVPFSPKAERFYEEGLAYWNLPVPAECSTVTRELVPLGSFALAEPGQLGEEGECTIKIAALLEEFPACEERELVFHEVGHLVGLEHTTDPRSYMTPDNGWQMCREWRAAWRAAHPKVHRGASLHTGRAR